MKILTSWVSILLAIILLATCIGILVIERDSYTEVEVSEFDFFLSFGPNGHSSIDTFKGIISKDLVRNGIVSTEFKLSDKEKSRLLDMLRTMDILAYPRHLDVVRYYDHVEYIYLKVEIDGIMHEVRWTVPWDFDFFQDERYTEIHLDFIVFVQYVKELVYGSEEFQSLPDAEGGYI